ncbi:tRNA (adenosine(37)-N6)-dimethylallyltransferase MiaA [Candidatus Sneabacter namystus]|uniref:tRNA dimethylallyltransferase n=1 Tax=Candidatus Sneabacter namystus TaxID=2601646 RepID=A0A5C0UH11_9RICK|nr:tRNA (adenosine(37)-N6)-dimethylallyltransferase MiaA [Candidatus Sneabacter namystus]QEK39378.1 tRNA (adenosine(37)-N6)-dimethylallyltransferase MiaA [Candidatus Sneabacter namystus]
MEVLIICGPTASGKSDLAVFLAKKCKGVIVNADSAQVYKEFRILTASPKIEDLQVVEHSLYNFLSVNDGFSVANYLTRAAGVIENIFGRQKYPIVVGGSGFYISALLSGVHSLPPVQCCVSSVVQEKIQKYGTRSIYDLLLKVDPVWANKISPNDSYRVARGYAVFLQTGLPLTSFLEGDRYNPLLTYKKKIITLVPERRILYEACDQRFDNMVQNGAVSEVKVANDSGVKMKNASNIIGVTELLQYVRGCLSYENAVFVAKQRTRNYAKRQITWFKNQITPDYVIKYSSVEELYSKLDDLSIV